jgi:hypothetical protein
MGGVFVKGKMRATNPRADGYVMVTLRKNGEAKSGYMHRMVAKAFLGDFSGNGLEVCHLNGNPSDNRVENLRWDTHAGNMAETRGAPKISASLVHPSVLDSMRRDRDRWREIALSSTCATCKAMGHVSSLRAASQEGGA